MIFMDPKGLIRREAPQISFLDHGFLFGDSLYEVVRVYGRRVLGWKGHEARLLESARRLRISIEDKIPMIRSRAVKLLGELNEGDAALRIIITRGVGSLHINPRTCGEPQVYMAAWKYNAESYSHPVSLLVARIRRNPRVALDPAIKSGNYLNSVLAYQEAQDAGLDDAVFLNPDGQITELTTSNIGWFRGDTICTPSDETGILLGITRQLLLETHKVETGRYLISALQEADEVFALSTFKEVLPVSLIQFENGQRKTFGSFNRTEKLRRSFHSEVEKSLANEPEWF